MPKINPGDYKLSVTAASTPGVAEARAYDKNVSRAQSQRAFEGEGAEYLTRPLKDIAATVGDFGVLFAKHEKEMLEVKAKDYSADLTNSLNQRYINDIASKRGSEAENIFKNEVLTIQEGKEKYLEQAGGNKRLRTMMALEYDLVSQKYLNDVLNHKLRQDAQYKQDVDIKVARSLQAKGSMLDLTDINKATETSQEIDAKLSNNPQLRELTKQAFWQDYFKSNARVNPELTQAVYANDKIKQNIIGEIGSDGYDAIQQLIDKGKSIKEHDDALSKVLAKEKEDKRIEKVMLDAHTQYTKGKLSLSYIDLLNIPSQEKRILDGLLIRQSQRKDEISIDYGKYVELGEQIRNPEQYGLTRGQVYNNILKEIDKTITPKQGEDFINRFSKIDTFKHPVVVDSYKELSDMYSKGKFEDIVDYYNAVSDLDFVSKKYNGDHVEVQKFMKEILLPRLRRGWISRLLGRKDIPETYEQGTPVGHYTLDGEIERIDKYLVDQKIMDTDGKQIIWERLNSDQQRKMLKFIRSQ